MWKLKLYALFLLAIIKIRFPKTKTLVQVIRERYGDIVLTQFRKLEKLEKKISKASCDISFLNTCARYNVTPKFLKFRLHKRNLERTDEYRSFQRDLLFREITNQNKHLNKLKTQRDETAEALRSSVSWLDYDHLLSIIENTVHNYSEHVKYVQKKKLFSLGFGGLNNGESINSVFNFSDYNLNLKEQEILSKGLKYVIGPRKPTFVKHFFEMETLFNYISRYGIIEPRSDNQPTFLSKFKILAHSYFKDINKYYNTISDFSKSDLQTLKIYRITRTL